MNDKAVLMVLKVAIVDGRLGIEKIESDER